MYTIQALWTAARHDIAAKFIVCNNGSYRLLQLNIDQYWKEQGIEKHDYPLSFDLSHPALGFVDIARGFGVPAVRVEKPHEIKKAVEQMLAAPGPFLRAHRVRDRPVPQRPGAGRGRPSGTGGQYLRAVATQYCRPARRRRGADAFTCVYALFTPAC